MIEWWSTNDADKQCCFSQWTDQQIGMKRKKNLKGVDQMLKLEAKSSFLNHNKNHPHFH